MVCFSARDYISSQHFFSMFIYLYNEINLNYIFLVKPDSRVIRTCGYENSTNSNRCYQRSGFGGRQEVCACKTDFCNRSASLGASVFLTVTLTILAKFYL